MSPALRDQARHNLARPPWPVATVSWLPGSPYPATALRVLDPGSGTGSGSRTAVYDGLGSFEQRNFELAFQPTFDQFVQLADSWSHVHQLPGGKGATREPAI